ncbi:hypothetical protein [Streptomyces sp. NPDC053048]|uniref:hypothetical protein n=1 Tax=Streptomyces sp. NPDC053048 TaxID=3365694 RepID=UPI0037D87BD1
MSQIPEPDPVLAVRAPEPQGLAHATAAPAACTPTPTYTNCVRFNYTGAIQHFTVPVGVTRINARMWGSGGRGYSPAMGQPSPGGGGGFTSGDVSVLPGETLTVVVGGYTGFGGGGISGPDWGGGGLSGLFSAQLQRPLLVAGGGGTSTYYSNGEGGAGGAGGGHEGGAGAGRCPGLGAVGATGGAGGADNSGNRGGRGGNPGATGGSNSVGKPGGVVPVNGLGGGGGAGATFADGAYRGGWGGGGYAGGGGAGFDGGAGSVGGGGGGGSGFAGGPGVSNGVTIAGSGAIAANTADPLYQPGIGNSNQHGQVVLQWEDPVFTVAQVAPDPVDMTPGVTTQMAFTVSADTTVPAGRTITLVFPSGVALAPGGVVRYICPAAGTNDTLDFTLNPDGSVSVTAPEIDPSTACFYSVDVQASPDPVQGSITVGGSTGTTSFSIS